MPSVLWSVPPPVPEQHVAALRDGGAVAKAWLLELIAAADLAAAPAVGVAQIAHDGPALCGAIVAALASDTASDRLAELAPRVTALAGATGPAGALAAVEALRRATWTCLAGGMSRGEEAFAAALALRLGHVAALLSAAAVLATASSSPGAVGATATASPPGAEGASAGSVPPAIAEPSITGAVQARDARGDLRAPRGWPVAVDRMCQEHGKVAVLLVEVADRERLELALGDAPFAELMGLVERALSAQLRPIDAHHPDGLGRTWLLLADSDDAAARGLAERAARAVALAAEHRGVPLAVSIGVAAAPGHGGCAAELMARAEMGVFSARAAGVPVAD